MFSLACKTAVRPAAAVAVSARSAQVLVRDASSLIIAEHDNATLSPSTLSAATAAQQLGGDVAVLVVGSSCGAVAEAAAAIPGVGKVLTSEDAAFGDGLAENLTEAAVAAIQGGSYTHVLTPSSNFAKNFVPRVAAKLDLAPIPDVVSIVDEATFVKPLYAGNAMATLRSSDAVKLLTIRPTAFDQAADSGGSASIEAAPAAATCNTGKSTFVSRSVSESERPDLTAAKVVVSGGRGMKSGDNFGMLEELADKLGGAVGASRAAVDAGYVPNEYQVGQTGKVVAPDLYVAVGISGAIQHLSGMKDSKTIVAINKDPDAPIFQVADYGLVEDLFEAVPELTGKV